MGVIAWGLASQIGLKLLSVLYAIWSTKAGKIAIGIAVAGVAFWLAADHYLDRAYERGVAETQARQAAVRREAVTAARAEGEDRRQEIERASEHEQAQLRALEARKLKVRNETETPDRVLLSADDPWLLSKQK